MKKVIIAGLILSLSNCYATQMKNVEILEHSSWISGSSDNIVLISGNLQENNMFSADTSASAYNASGKVNSNIYMSGSHGVRISNTSNSDQYYTLDIKLCTDTSACFNDRTSVRVGKGGNYSTSFSSRVTASFTSPGNYGLTASTVISGESSSSKSDRANVSISK